MTISAKIIADSVSPFGMRLTTLQLRYPKFIHGEFMTHRVFSRNASSSRAIPVERLIQDVLDDPARPSYWGKNQRGMQADEECAAPVLWDCAVTRDLAWAIACDSAVDAARRFAKAGYHKQIVNRLLEPFCHINVVVTATEWSNFFALRCHPGAQPEMRLLAEDVRDAMAGSAPVPLRPGEWHLPYCPAAHGKPIGLPPRAHLNDDAIKASVARCARVSYLTQEGRESTIEEDLALYNRLVSAAPLHASPAEHQATPDEEEQDYYGAQFRSYASEGLHGNFRGWIQYRKLLPGESQ